MLIETLSTFPHMYDSVMGSSMMRIAQEKGIIEFRAYDLRDWTRDRHRTTDDEPYGGGDGLVMKCEPIFDAVKDIVFGGIEADAAAACGARSPRDPGGSRSGVRHASAIPRISGTTDALAHPSATCDSPAEDGGEQPTGLFASCGTRFVGTPASAPRRPLSLEQDGSAVLTNGGTVGAADACGTQSSPLFRPLRGTKAAWVEGGAGSGTTDALAHPSATGDVESSDCSASTPGDVEGFDSGAAARDGGGGVPRAVPHDANAPVERFPKQDCASMACPRPRPARACVVFLAPQGRRFDDALACELAREQRLLFVCGHYEGIDERAYELADEVVSLGDYVLTSGELASMVVIDAVVRKLPGVLGAEAGAQTESFADGLLEYPQYTRPADFRGREVPAVLLSGDHGAVARWRREQSLERTARLRPDLLESAELSEADREFLHTLGFGGDAQGA